MLKLTTLAALSASAFALPEPAVEVAIVEGIRHALTEHRALQAACWSGAFTAERCCDVKRHGPGGDSTCWSPPDYTFVSCCGEAAPAPTAADPDFLQEVTDAAVADADGNHQLWFYAVQPVGEIGGGRCGEVDAAPYMPAALFEPQNILSLLAYVTATVDLYRVPVLDKPVMFGRCAQKTEFTNCNGGRVGGIGWTPRALMGPVCQERCSDGLYVDDPANGNFCSLCSGEGEGSPGTVSIDLCYSPPPPPPPPPPGPAQCTASSCPCSNGNEEFCRNARCPGGVGRCDGPICSVEPEFDYGQYPQVTCGPEPPPPLPNADNHLWFYYVNTAFGRCGEVDAAPFVPESLFEPQNLLELGAYAEATVSLYQVAGPSGTGPVTVTLGRCADAGYTVAGSRAGQALGLDPFSYAEWAPSRLMRPTCAAECGCAFSPSPSSQSTTAPIRPGSLRTCGTGRDPGPTSASSLANGGPGTLLPIEPDHPVVGTGSICSLCGDYSCPTNAASLPNGGPGGCSLPFRTAAISLYYLPSSRTTAYCQRMPELCQGGH